MYCTFNVTAEEVPVPEPEPENEWSCEPPPPVLFVETVPIPQPLPEADVPPEVPGWVVFITWLWAGICAVDSVVAPVVPLTLTLIEVLTVWLVNTELNAVVPPATPPEPDTTLNTLSF